MQAPLNESILDNFCLECNHTVVKKIGQWPPLVVQCATAYSGVT